MHRRGRKERALGLLLSFDTYMRPSVVVKVKCEDVLRPAAVQGLNKRSAVMWPSERMEAPKTGTMDDTVDVSDANFQLSEFLKELVDRKGPEKLLLNPTPKQYREDVAQAVRDLKLEKLKLVKYQARHGGATRDILLQRRELEAVQKRGSGGVTPA